MAQTFINNIPISSAIVKLLYCTSVLKIINLKKGVGIQAIKSCETSYLYVVIANSITT